MTKSEVLHIDGLVNARDLGGLVTRDGRVVRTRQVIRTDNLKGLSAQGQRDLADIGLALVVDLRMGLEVEREGYVIAHDPSVVVNLPMLPQAGLNEEQVAQGAAGSLVEDYIRQIDVNAVNMTQALRLIADPQNRPVVVHCTAGKDRTGLVIAMLLDILGVDHETIVADYHVSNTAMEQILERIRGAPVYQDIGLAQAPVWIFAAEAETMREFLALMTERYGNAEQWALDAGMSVAEIQSLRATLLG